MKYCFPCLTSVLQIFFSHFFRYKPLSGVWNLESYHFQKHFMPWKVKSLRGMISGKWTSGKLRLFTIRGLSAFHATESETNISMANQFNYHDKNQSLKISCYSPFNAVQNKKHSMGLGSCTPKNWRCDTEQGSIRLSNQIYSGAVNMRTDGLHFYLVFYSVPYEDFLYHPPPGQFLGCEKNPSGVATATTHTCT